MRRLFVGLFSTFAVISFVGCVQEEPKGPIDGVEDESQRAAQGESLEGRRQGLNGDRDHWFAVGADSRGQAMGPKGEPQQKTGQFVNEGTGVDFGDVGKKGWLVASKDGWVQLLDEKGKRTGPNREAIGKMGELRFLAGAPDTWLAGGTNGKVHKIDRDGQPTGTTNNPFNGDPVVAGAYGNGQWLIASKKGELYRLDLKSLQEQSSLQTLGSGHEVVGIVRVKSKWVALTKTGYAEVDSGGPRSVTTIASGRTITAFASKGDTVLLGSDDGHILHAQVANLGSASWTQALGSHAVRDFANDGNEWLAVGDAGAARKIDSKGQPVGSMKTLSKGNDLGAVRPTSKGWMIGLSEVSAVQSFDKNLDSGLTETDLLDGTQVNDVAAGAPGLLVVGASGKYRIIQPEGSPKTKVKTLGSAGDIETAGWNGDQFLVGTSNGTVATIDKSGEVADKKEQFGGDAIVGSAWSGRFWLVVSGKGEFLRLRKDGSKYQSAKPSGLDVANATKFNGDEWMIVGSKDSKAAFTIVGENGSISSGPTKEETVDGELRALGWNGREWLTGGDGGIVIRIDQAGSVITGGQQKGIRDALYGQTVRSISFNGNGGDDPNGNTKDPNGNQYLIGGDNGAVRRLDFQAYPIRPAIAINEYRTVFAIDWANPRGFPGGPCVTADFCLDGACLGNVSTGFCCDSKCDSPCESCFKDVTGKPSGTCSPIPKGEEPPMRKKESGADCVAEMKKTCGTTGKCDGNGQCAYFDTDVQCKAATCTEGEATAAAHCDGSGSCVMPNSTECAPYAGCDGDACIASCETDEQCVPGYVCKDNECVDRGMQNDDGDDKTGDGNGKKKGEKKDGCSVGAGGRPLPGLPTMIIIAAGVLAIRPSSRVDPH